MIDLLLHNGDIHTLDTARPVADALAIQGGRIVAVGGAGELDHLVGPGTKRHDLGGRTVIPGMIDAHIHWEKTALALRHVSLFDLTTLEASIAKIREAAARIPEGEWIVGFGWSQEIWTDNGGEFPTAAHLDSVAPRHPVYLTSRSYHSGWCNSLAMARAGITAASPDPESGTLPRDAAGAPTGILLERAMELVADIIPQPTLEDLAARMEEAQQLAWRSGLTGIHDFDHTSAFEAFQLLHQRGKLGLRVLKQMNDPIIEATHAVGLRFGFGDDWLRIGALKMFADGALGSVTARMVEPYVGQPDNRGMVVMPKDRMREHVLAATRRGIPSSIHAIGDQAVRDVLDVFADARALEATLGIARTARRHRIEHVQIIQPSDVARLAQLDIIGSFQPIHATADYPFADRLWGDRCALAYNPRVQLDLGACVAFGSDSPIEPFDPIAGIHAAVTRRRADGSPVPDGWYPNARLTLDEALHGFTTGPAWAAGLEHHQGRLAPTHFADLVVLDRNPWKLRDTMELLDVRPVATMSGGVWRWREE